MNKSFSTYSKKVCINYSNKIIKNYTSENKLKKFRITMVELPPFQLVENKGQVPPHFSNLLSTVPEENRMCSICTTIVQNNFYLTPCYHLFHENCIEEWLQTKKECPICKKKC